MQCYICESERQPTAGLMHWVSEAAGVCHECGIGLCLRHGHRAKHAGAPFLCADCARVLAGAEKETAQGVLQTSRELVGAP